MTTDRHQQPVPDPDDGGREPPEDAESSPLRRRVVKLADAADARAGEDVPDAEPSVDEGERRRPKTVASAAVGEGQPATAARATVAPRPGDSRPIRRDDVYRHEVVGGREVRATIWRRIAIAIREALTSKGERTEQELNDRLTRPARVHQLNKIAVVSPKGGVGKTTTTWLVGDALARLGRLDVCAVDANPDYGTLGHLVPEARRAERSLSDLLDDFADPGRPLPSAPELSPYFSRTAAGLRVLQAPADDEVMAQMGPAEYERLLQLLSNQMEVVLLDCGTGLASPLAKWALETADQVLIVTTPDWVTANNVAAALRHVPAEKATLVLNQVRPRAAGSRSAITDHFARQAVQRRHQVPYDESLRTMLDSGTYELEDMNRTVRIPVKELAAQVGEGLL